MKNDLFYNIDLNGKNVCYVSDAGYPGISDPGSRLVKKALDKSTAPIMYLCNIVTQPGETDDFTVGDHVKLLNRYLDKKKVNVVIANNEKIEEEMAKRYESEEQKDPVLIDYEELEKIGVELIEEDLIDIDNNTLKHDSLILSSLIFSYLMRKNK